MPRNSDEKEKCLEKLVQMEKFLPFLDFMIKKINEKTNEIPLDCQLGKFQLLKSMIEEKSGKYTWDIIVKVEDVIHKLITKLNYNEECIQHQKKSKKKTESTIEESEEKIDMTTVISIPSSTPTTSSNCPTTASHVSTSPPTSTIDFTSANSVDQIINILKISVDNKTKNVKEQDAENTPHKSESVQSVNDTSTSTPNLEKDLESMCKFSNTSLASQSLTSEKTTSNDLLSSSREKLLKSLQQKLHSGKSESLKTSDLNKNIEKSSASAFSSDIVTTKSCDKVKSDKDRTSESIFLHKNSSETKSFRERIPKTGYTENFSADKRFESDGWRGDYNMKQKLREKLSADICEVYRVSGRSVGGSLRSLKEHTKVSKTCFEEEESFKVDKVSEGSGFTQTRAEKEVSENKKLNNPNYSRKDVEKKKLDGKIRKKKQSENLGKTKKINKSCHDVKKDNKKGEHSKKEKQLETPELNNLNDEELLDLVKENTQFFPHLAKLKPVELRQAVSSSLQPILNLSDLEGISDDSFQDPNDVLSDTNSTTDMPKYSDSNKIESDSNKKKSNNKNLSISKATKDFSNSVVGSNAFEDNTKDINYTEDLDDDFAQKLIENLNPPAPAIETKKGFAESSLPYVNNSSSFLVSNSKTCISDRDPRKKKHLLQSASDTSSSLIDTDKERFPKESLPSSSQHVSFKSSNSQINRYFEKGHGINKVNETLQKEEAWYLHSNSFNQNTGHFSQFGKRLPSDLYSSKYPSNMPSPNPQLNAPCNEKPKNFSFHTSYEPKSYAEYKRMKRRQSEKQYQLEASCKKNESNLEINLKTAEVPSTASEIHSTSQTSKDPKTVNSCLNNKSIKTNHLNRTSDNRGKISNVRKQTDNSDSDVKENSRRKSCSEDFRGEVGKIKNKVGNDKRTSSDSEELISPLKTLYGSGDKPKTGKGYGLQNFKIPKKNKSSIETTTKIQKENVSKEQNELTRAISLTTNENQISSSEINIVEREFTKEKVDNESKVDCGDGIVMPSDSEGSKNENKSKKSCEHSDGAKEVLSSSSNQSIPKKSISDLPKEKTFLNQLGETEVSSSKCSESNQHQSSQSTKKTILPEAVHKGELQVADCDSSTYTTPNNVAPAKDESQPDGSTSVISKEEITQEFVEALIRKSFQSGDGRLLLAQAKLFEKFAQKLNSKKLKTIQKIINSESETSSSSYDSSSEEEKRKQKEKKMKKRKKKMKKNKKIITSSSSSISEESDDEEKAEKNREANVEKTENSCSKRNTVTSEGDNDKNTPSMEILGTSDKPVSKANENCKDIDVGNCISKKKTKRKQGQKKLLEQILNESPGNEGVVDQKTKPKPKIKLKTELDRLHDDIRNMFICSGVVTATGQRMCRILKESGGNINNLDIVKESAKMVEEEKLKKVSIRRSRAGTLGSRSRSQSLDKSYARDRSKSRSRIKSKEKHHSSEENDENEKQNFDEIISNQPVVLLHKINLDSFGYGFKISENCVSFSRLKGRNMAIRNIPFTNDKKDIQFKRPIQRVYLPRNLRKLNRLKDKNVKLGYVGRKLADVVKNLPLKMAKMKHLKMEEQEISSNKSKSGLRKPDLKKKNRVEQELMNLLNYSFVKKRTEYPCRLCPKVLTNITSHYKNVHPLSEVLISRLSKIEAKKAKTESMKNNGFEKEDSEKIHDSEKYVENRCYYCRMCNSPKFTEFHAFFIHVSGHTGEYEYQCPSLDCGVTVQTRDDLKLHIFQKHEKRRCEMYNKLTEFFVLPSETSSILFGYLCSLCNFVQLNRQRVESHIKKEHPLSRNVRTIKIDMSCKKVNGEKGVALEKNLMRSSTEKNDIPTDFNVEPVCMKKGEGFVQMKSCEATYPKVFQNQSDSTKTSHHENPNTSENEKLGVVTIKPGVESLLVSRHSRDELLSDTFNKNKLKINNKTSEECKSFEATEFKTGETMAKVRVGPFEVHLSENIGTQYKCYVESCTFSTNVFDLFEKHIKNNHTTTKWVGNCDICSSFTKTKGPKIFNLEKALEHLKHHQNLLEELKMEMSEDQAYDDYAKSQKSQSCALNSEIQLTSEKEFFVESNQKVESQQEHQKVNSNIYNSETCNPLKPLLRVRNLVGDRLSTPKDTVIEENVSTGKEGITSENHEAEIDSKEDSPLMFTIENVRSLKSDSEFDCKEDDIRVEEILSPSKNEDKKRLTGKKGNRKAVLVRPCPTRKIAIRPETSSAPPVEVGKIQIVSAPRTGHPVVLNPLSQSSPLRLMSTLPVITNPPPNVDIKTTMSCGPKLVTLVPTKMQPTSNAATPASSPDENPKKYGKPRTKVYRPEKNKVSQGLTPASAMVPAQIQAPVQVPAPEPAPTLVSAPVEGTESEQKASNSPLKRHASPNFGNKKSVMMVKMVKDGKVYQAMLTKTKLCHLFKCMSVECSFTCNNEIVFKLHIGLHRARRDIKGEKKFLRTFVFENINKTAYTWQQCAYCCEVLMDSASTLSQHIVNEHGHCIYQCAYCFYRAVSQSYVEIHQNTAHSQTLKSSSRIIYKCKPFTSGPSPLEALEKHGKRQSVRPYICDQCGQKFFITQEFMKHLTTEHQSVTAYTCHICKNLCFKADRLIVHYKLHSYCTYQCPYCLHGTETQKEMLFHLCNFHFSQAPCMYVRALAENQTREVAKRSNKKKKSSENQLKSLKVIFYDNESLQPECTFRIVNADSEEENEEASVSSSVTEPEMCAENRSNNLSTSNTEELAILSETRSRSLSVENILPNAQFSSENEASDSKVTTLESENKNDAFPISPLTPTQKSNTDSFEDKNLDSQEFNIQNTTNLNSNPIIEEKKNENSIGGVHKLPLMIMGRVSGPKSVCQAKNSKVFEELPQQTVTDVITCDKSLKIGELLFNLQKKKKNVLVVEKKINDSEVCAKIDKPLVSVSRVGCAKNVYPGKSFQKAHESISVEAENEVVVLNSSCSGRNENSEALNSDQSKEINVEQFTDLEKVDNSKNCLDTQKFASNEGVSNSSNMNSKEMLDKEKSCLINKDEVTNGQQKLIRGNNQPVITNVVSLSDNSQNWGENSGSIIISDVCSMTYSEQDIADPNSSKILINLVNSKTHSPSALKPPVIRVEDYVVDEGENVKNIQSQKSAKDPEDSVEADAESPEVVILDGENNAKDILTVTLDSDEERGTEEDPLLIKPGQDEKDLSKKLSSSDDTIRKEMELLREQMASETDCLLFDDEETESQQFIQMCKTASTASKQSTLVGNLKTKGVDVEEINENIESGKKHQSLSDLNNTKRTRYGTRRSLVKSDNSENGERRENENGNVSECENKKNEEKVNLVKEGLTGKELYLCGNGKCNFRGEGEAQLKEHLLVCDLLRESSTLVCPHCNRKIKNLNFYIEHLKHHGEKKFCCGLCSFSSAVDYSVIRHLKQKHKCLHYKITPKDSSSPDHFLFYPRNFKTEKQSFEEKGYSPGDEDKLPLQSVYQVNVKCAKCPYFTKVRSNMVRHLKIHAKSAETEGSVVVPSTAPTNPVPCLDTKEKMFDKMTNLAASSQLAKDKNPIEGLSPEEEAKLPQFVAEQMRYKCCLSDCNYITIDDGMLKHHIKALHDEISYYSCPHCKNTVHVDVRHVTLDKIGYHLKHHDARLYKCAHCIYFHYQKNIVEKHTVEKHPDRRFFVHTVREPKNEVNTEEELSKDSRTLVMWKCNLCEFQCQMKSMAFDHLVKKHNTRSKYKCKHCCTKSNHNNFFTSHFASKHPGEKVEILPTLTKVVLSAADLQSSSSGAESSSEYFDTTPLWQRGAPRIRHIRGILIEEEEIKTKKSKKISEEKESEIQDSVSSGNAFYCPLCSDKKKIFYTRNPECFRSHLYHELNYQQFACILCGKMFVDKKDFDKHHARQHPDKTPSMKQTKEDGEIKFWVDKVIAKQEEQIQARKRKLSEDEGGEGQGLPKRKKNFPTSN